MFNRDREDRGWRRYDDERAFRRRRGALDRRWGYGERLDRGIRETGYQAERPFSDKFEDDNDQDYDAPDYWLYQKEWMEPGPYSGVGPRNYRRSDERIFEDVCRRLSQHAQIDASDIEVEVKEGEVTLKGSVENRRTKRMVEANVDRISGVIDVHNRLRLKDREEARREQRGERPMDNPFPGGPVPTGNAGYDEPQDTDRR
jgi:hypothetical protein